MSTIDTTQIYSSGGYLYTFNEDGQGFLLDGTPATGITVGFNPIPPCEFCLSSALTAAPDLPVLDPVCCTIEPSNPVLETPEPETGHLLFLALAILLIAFLLIRKYDK